MSGPQRTLPLLAALKCNESGVQQALRTRKDTPPQKRLKAKKDATAIARQRRSQRLPAAREPDLQARFLELASGDRSRRGCGGCGGGGGCRGRCRGGVSLAERLFLRRFLRAFLFVGFDLRLDGSTGPLVVFLF